MPGHKRAETDGVPADRLPPTPSEIWDMQPGEPPRWYARFEVYRSHGPHRTLMNAYRECAKIEGLVAIQPDPYWYEISRKWAWQARACAWDAVEREQARATEQERRFDIRERRLQMVDRTLSAVYTVLEKADLANMTKQEARDKLPTIRMMFRDMINAEVREFGVPDDPWQTPEPQEPVYNADTLRRFALEFEEWQANEKKQTDEHAGENGNQADSWENQKPPRPARAPAAVPSDNLALNQTLLVCAGPESKLMVDVAALRAIKATTGLPFHRILAVTRHAFDTYLHREQAKNRPVRLLHMAACPAYDGLHFADGVVTGNWLSERMAGVRLLLLSGCHSHNLPAWVYPVPQVITIAAGISPTDAAALTLHFWCAIGRGIAPPAALDDAVAHCAPVVSHYVVPHW